MKIFFCETSNDGTLGGSHSCMYNLVRYSDRTRYRFTVGFFSENPFVERYRELGVDVALMPSVPSRRNGPIIARKAINWYQREYKLEKYLSAYIYENKFDILLMNNTIFESKNFTNVGSRLGLPVVVYERGIMKYSREHIFATEGIDASIAVSDAILQNMFAYKFKSKIIKLIYDGVDPVLFEGPFNRVEIKKELEIPLESKVIGIIGNVRYWKGQKYFIEACTLLAQMYPDLYGLIIGGWGEMDHDYLEVLQQTVRDAGLESRIRFLGYRKDTPALLSILDIFVHASIQPEPFGMVLLEAMAARIPIIATRFGGPIEILDAGGCGALVPPEDGRSIAEECEKYFSDESYRRDTVEKAYKRLCEKFHIVKTVNRVGQLIETVQRNRIVR
jgi:glycosyltransferase involved in cell wall biosynthesis